MEVKRRSGGGSIDFCSYYETLCALQDSCPFREIISGGKSGRIIVNADRLAVTDWHPLLKALQINKSLESMSFRRYRRRKPTAEERQLWTRCRFGARGKHPAISKREISMKLCRAIANCLTLTSNLHLLELEDISIKLDHIQTLSTGLMKNSSVKHLSLKYCQIGDRCLEVLCKGIRNRENLATVDFSGCCLTWKGAKTIAELIKYQATQRHSQAWKESLRQKEPNVDKMAGLRRITLSSNQLVGDKGAALLAEALEDDLWVKALDLQQCGISNKGARQLLACLEYKTNLCVLDIRLNPLIDSSLRNSILHAVAKEDQEEFPWLGLVTRETEEEKAFPKRSFPGLKISAKRQQTDAPSMYLKSSSRKKKLKDQRTRYHSKRNEVNSRLSETVTMTTDSDVTASMLSSMTQSSDGYLLGKTQIESFHKEIQKLRVSVELCKTSLAKEVQRRAEAEARIIELEVGNIRLRNELIKKDQVSRKLSLEGKVALQDESTLEAVETAIKKFHSFVDLLKSNELGHLIQMQ
eukprot:m.67819 g.67819  ORF g.67819 m.67819 type:complete len:524 (+) comp35475_c0_seq9:14-1585(+)